MGAEGRLASVGRGTLELTVGETARRTPDFVAAAAAASLARGETTYPDMAGLPELRGAIAAYMTGVHGSSCRDGTPFSPGRVVVTTGGTHALSVALRLAGADRVAIVTPAWSGFFAVAAAARVDVVEVPLAVDDAARGGWRLDLAALDAALAGGCGAVILNSPNNPTGWVADEATLGDVLDVARRRGAWVVADEIYHRQGGTGAASPSFHDVAHPGDRVLYAQSLSKNWSMTGWRVGWLEVPEGLSAAAVAVVEGTTHGVPTFVQRAATAAVAGGAAFLADQAAAMRRGRSRVVDALAATGLFDFVPPRAGPFVFFRDPEVPCGAALSRRLERDAGLSVIPGLSFGSAFGSYVRLCFTREEGQVAEAVHRIEQLPHRPRRALGTRA